MSTIGTPLQNMPIKGQSGAIPSGNFPGGSTTLPVTGTVPVSGNPVAATQANPFAAPTATTTGATSGAIPATVPTVNGLPAGSAQTNGINWTDGSNTVTGDFKDTYGAGTGTAISQVLSGLGTATDSAVQATINNTNLEAQKQYGNIQASEAAGGVTPNSSTAALAEGDFYSTVNSQLQQTISGMELNEEGTLLGALTNEGTAHGPDESTWDSIMNGISDVGSIAGSVVGAVSSIPGLSSLGGLLSSGKGSTTEDNSGLLADIG